MAFNSKLDVFKINLNSEKSENSFRRLFTSLVTDDDSPFMDVFQKFITKVDLSDFHTNLKRKKAFTAYDTQKTDENEPSIIPLPAQNIICGYLEGGKFGKKRSKSAIGEKANRENLHKKTLILDRYFFLLYLPLDSKIGVAILHSYSSDSIADIFLDFLKSFFSDSSKGYKKPKIERFFPKAIADEFDKKSEVKKFIYTSRMVLGHMSDTPVQEQKKVFTIKVEAAPDKNIKKDQLPSWLKTVQSILLKSGENSRLLGDFENGKVYLQHNQTKKETPFEIQKDFQIKPAIYLDGKVKMDEDDNPEHESLKSYCIQLLKDIKEEIYPINALKER